MKRVRLIALDMDGTLLSSDHQTVPRENIDAICRADAAGICVCICTGRMLEDASDFITSLQLPCVIIACNGTRISDGPLPKGHILYRRSFEPQDAKRVLDLVLPYRIMINGFEDGRVNTVAFSPDQHYHLTDRGLIDASYGEKAIYEAAQRGIMKFYISADGYAGANTSKHIEDARKAIKSAFPELQITQSAPGNIEIMLKDANKGTALAFLAQSLGLRREQVMAMGDAENDLCMLEYAYHSVAMANGTEKIKSVCRYQTMSNDECGVAKMIDRVLEAMESQNE